MVCSFKGEENPVFLFTVWTLETSYLSLRATESGEAGVIQLGRDWVVMKLEFDHFTFFLTEVLVEDTL